MLEILEGDVSFYTTQITCARMLARTARGASVEGLAYGRVSALVGTSVLTANISACMNNYA